MQSNTPYLIPLDQNSKNSISISQPVLTRSLPSIVGSVPTSLDNVIVSGICQSYVSSANNVIGTQSRTPMTVIGGTGDCNVSQKSSTVQNYFQNSLLSQKFIPPVISTTRPIPVRTQASYSTVIPSTKYQRRNATTRMTCPGNATKLISYQPINSTTRLSSPLSKTRSESTSAACVSFPYDDNVRRGRSFSQISDKSKKKSKPRLKCKYLLKVINIQESINPGESILTFEMMVPMNQMRFTCCLSNEINTLDVSNSVGQSGQIPGELGKKDILESLVNTVKKICQMLTDDISSIPLYEDYVFHPCLPNSGLVKLADYVLSIPTSFDSDINQLSVTNNINLSLQAHNNFYSSCTSSRSLSRHPSNEDISFSTGNLLTATSGQLSSNLTEKDLILFCENDSSTFLNPHIDNQQSVMKSVIENDSNHHIIASSKCCCPVSDSSLKVPEYIFSTTRQIVEKLINLHCKGLIILPQSNDILTRNFRVLEIPADHMFVGLPCSDSSYNVVKGQKDKDFIIAKDTRDPENVIEKCVYQKPSDGAVLLDSSGEIQYIQKPSLIIPSKQGHGSEKTTIIELPSELTHYNDQSLVCDQIVSVLQSLTQIQRSKNQSKDELFDSPVLLEEVQNLLPKQQSNISNKSDASENCARRGSDESIISQIPSQSQIQVERISCQYFPLPRAGHDESTLIDNTVRDLPRQHVRSRKISNESLESAIRTRATSTVTFVSDADFQRVIANNQMSLHGAQKSVPIGTIVSQGPSQRVNAIGSTAPAPFLVTNQTPSNPGNIFLQNVQNVPHYPGCSQGATAAMSQIPVVLPNSSSMNVNFSHILPNQMMLPAGITPTQLSQYQQIQQNSCQRITVPSSMSSANLSSSQIIAANLQTMQQSIITGHHGASSFGDINDSTATGISRQIRQMSTASPQFYDANIIQSMIAENLRTQLKNQPTNAQAPPSQHAAHTTQAVLASPSDMVTVVSATPLKMNTPDNAIPVQDFEYQQLETDNKQKTEQTVGRFVIRPVTDSTANT